MTTPLRCAISLASLASCAMAQVAQLTPPPHPLFPEPWEPGADPIVACNLPEQFVPRTLWNANLWPNGIVHYQFEADVTQQNRDRTRIALNELETFCGVRFVPRTTQTAYINVRNGTGNSSAVGRTGGAQNLNMISWSSRYIICHEFMHALGVWHEQQRPDRETYVTIVTANIQPGYEGNFTIRSTATPHNAFDFQSIMLYDDCSFSTCCPAGSTCGCAVSCATILAQPGYESQQNLMGNRSSLSQGDKDGLVSRYGPPVDDAYEDNDTLGTAVNLPIAAPNTLRLIDDADFFNLPVAFATPISASIEAGVWASSNVTLALLSPSGTVLRTAQPADADGDGVYTASVSLTTGITPGVYRLRVTKTQRWGGDYTLTANGTCDDIDFNNNGVFPEDQDVIDFVSVLAGASCAACNDIDFNNNLVFPEDQDVIAFFNTLAGGACP
ncbi:MAG TPA: M12 family metallopeptidase [Phycisphaerales bacterium]|nr:M12 family metallopeptidase [Phycisphaerales bacterium]